MAFDSKTYSVGVHFNAAASPTDVFTISGVDSRSVKIAQMRVSGLATTAGAVNMNIIKRSTANTGGTSANLTAASHDSNDPTPSAVVKNYTANPTALGTAIGTVRAERLTLPLAGTQSAFVIFDFGIRLGKPIILNSSTEFLCLNCNGAAPAGTSLSIYIEWVEE
jgi:hypothetical protein